MDEGGIVFLRTEDLEATREFYAGRMGMEVWLEQADCVLLRRGNMILGFCSREDADFGGLLTFVYPNRAGVDEAYSTMGDLATTEPEENDRYGIYQFFGVDHEGRNLEFQAFLHPTEPSIAGADLLARRRSVRQYSDEPVDEEVLGKLFEMCRWAPSSMCRESYYYVLVRGGEARRRLAAVRGSSSAPIGRAPLAVAACSDPSLTGSPGQDGAIAAYHLMLAARTLELGTCWIGHLDTPEVKEILGVPGDHHVATVTPLGYPRGGFPEPSGRREAGELFGELT
jgi:nitroreductase